jgi:hypothetical protein
VLGIDPFDEPNVAESKEEHQRGPRLAAPAGGGDGRPTRSLGWLRAHQPGDYVSLQAYVPFGQDDALESLRRRVRDHLGGFAGHRRLRPPLSPLDRPAPQGRPQHGGGGPDGAGRPRPELAIPDKPYDFGTLIAAQSIGDHQSLLAHGRRVIRVAVDDLATIS